MAERPWHQPHRANRSNRKQPFSFDREFYKQRHRIENAFCRLKDFRRALTRYDRLARNFHASVCLAGATIWSLDPNCGRGGLE
jgi:transposase